MLRPLLLPIAVAVVSASASAQPPDHALLDTLLENAAITPEQHAALVQSAAAGTRGRSRGDDPGAHVSLGPDGLEIESADGRFSFDLGARLHVDWTRHSGDTGPVTPLDRTDVRRARISIGGRLDDAWRFSGETDFAGNEVALKDFWLAYEVRDGLRVTLGQQKQPYSLAVEMSSNDLPFVERGIDNALLAPFIDRAVGVRVDAAGERWFAAGGVYGEPIDDDHEGWGTAGRLVFTPIAEETRVLHLGIRGAYREPDTANAAVRIRDETTNSSDVSIVDTAALGAVESVTLFGPEVAFASGPFSVTGEYNRARLDHAPGTRSFDSWHVAATWSPSGESRAAAYDADGGEFLRLEPSRAFARGAGSGAWELAGRYAAIDLNDESLVGGEEKTISLAANWYPNRNVRVMLDWTRVLETDGSTALRAAAEGLDIVTLRGQYAF